MTMDRLEQYIKDNRESFDFGELPEGSRERLMKKWEKTSGRGLVRLGRVAAGIAASVALAFVFGYAVLGGGGRPSVDYLYSQEYISLLTTLDDEIVEMSRCCDSRTAKEAVRAARSIVDDVIPLEDQLPAEISAEERELILREYYQRKAEGLERIKDYLAVVSETN